MRTRTWLVGQMVAVVLLGLTCHSGLAEEQCKKKKDACAGKLRHIVLLAFKEGTSAKDIKKIEVAFAALPAKIPTIVDFEWGTNNSPEGLDDGFTHCFLVTFDDAEGRAVYLPHKAHKEFVGLLRPHMEKVLVIDYVAQE